MFKQNASSSQSTFEQNVLLLVSHGQNNKRKVSRPSPNLRTWAEGISPAPLAIVFCCRWWFAFFIPCSGEKCKPFIGSNKIAYEKYENAPKKYEAVTKPMHHMHYAPTHISQSHDKQIYSFRFGRLNFYQPHTRKRLLFVLLHHACPVRFT